MIIKILGSGCKNCVSLKDNTELALKEAGIEAEIVKVEDYKDIVSYGVMRTPALVIDEKVVSFGKVLKPKDIIKEFNRYNKPRFLIAAFSWALMLNSSIRAYQLGSITIVAALLSLTPILNSLVELIFNKDTNKIIQKIVVSILLILGVILVNL